MDVAGEEKEDFFAVFEEDSDDNLELWRALVRNEASLLPKKGELAVYFPQGHLEYADSILSSSLSVEAPTFDLKPEILCRVQHVNLCANKLNDGIFAHVTLLPELEEFEMYGSHHEVVVKDLQRTEWTFSITYAATQGIFLLSKGWKTFAQRKRLMVGDSVVFLRCQDGSLRLTVKGFRNKCGIPEYILVKHYLHSNFLSPVADAILNKSIFEIFYCPSVGPAGFVVPYHNYMKSITRPWMIGTKFQIDGSPRPWIVRKVDNPKRPAKKWTSFDTDNPSIRYTGVVTGISESDPIKWPNSKWKCLMVQWDTNKAPETQVVSPWEMMCLEDSSHSVYDSGSEFLSEREKESSMIKEVVLGNESGKQGNLRDTETDRQSSQASVIKEPTIIKPTHLKINDRQDQEIPLDMLVHNSLQYLEFNLCSFHSPLRLRYFPVALKSFKISHCVNSEHILDLLMDQKGLPLESLELDGCDSLFFFPIDKLPVTLRKLKIANCRNLMSLDKSFTGKEQVNITRTMELRELTISDCGELEFLPEGLHNLIHLELLSISNCTSLICFPEGGLPKNCLTLAIHECENLMFLPAQLHEFTSLRNLSVFSCPCLTSFPEEDLPPNLVSLHINDCDNLVHVSHWRLHKLKHLRCYSFSA